MLEFTMLAHSPKNNGIRARVYAKNKRNAVRKIKKDMGRARGVRCEIERVRDVSHLYQKTITTRQHE